MTVTPPPDQLQNRIAAVASSLPAHVRLIGVTKYKPSSAIRAAYAAGIHDFGESKVQEAIAKQAELADLTDITWHLIGHLQSNKARKAVQHFDWIHSVDSLKIAQRLDAMAAEVGRIPHCCLQVKMVPDPAKFGFSLDELWAALPQLDQLEHLKIVGLMTIPPQGSAIADAAAIFKQAKNLVDQINDEGLNRLHLSELSMGMSQDYPTAIAAGSTLVRLGTTLFGDRPA